MEIFLVMLEWPEQNPKALDGCGLLCFPQTGGDLEGKKKHVGELQAL